MGASRRLGDIGEILRRYREILGRDSLHEDPVRQRVDARHDWSHAVVGEGDDRRAHLRVRGRGRGRGRGRIRVRVRV